MAASNREPSRQDKFERGSELAEVLPLEAVHSRYAGEWVLLKVTAVDETQSPLEGLVVAHGAEPKVRKVVLRLLSPQQEPRTRYYLFAAGERLLSSPTVGQKSSGAEYRGNPEAPWPV